MPYKDIEKRREAGRLRSAKYRAKNRDDINAKDRERRQNDPAYAERCRANCRRWMKENPERRRVYKREWANQNPESRLATQRKTKLGIPKSEQWRIFHDQNGKCAICSRPITFLSGHLDHNHQTKMVRGFLCRFCNHILGNAQDSLLILQSAVAYLESYDHIA